MKTKKKTKKSKAKAKKVTKPKKSKDKNDREGHFLSLGDMAVQNKFGADEVDKFLNENRELMDDLAKLEKSEKEIQEEHRPFPLPVSSVGEPTIHWLPKWMRKLFFLE